MKLKYLLVTGALVLAVGCVPGGTRSAIAEPPVATINALKQTSAAFNSVAEAGIPAIVNISTVKKIKQQSFANPFFDDPFFRRFFDIPEQNPGNGQKFKQQAVGSGVIVSDKGYILTNNHVVEGADEITVTLSDKREFKAEVIGKDPKTDIAVLKIKGDKLPVVKMGNSDQLKVGDWAIAIGSPFGLSKSVTVGIISAKGRSNVGITDYENFIQTDAAINPGNSGGALMNIDGEVIGINTAIFSKSGGYMGIGFAIPINMAKKIMDDLINTGKVVPGWLGVSIQAITEDLQKQFNLPNQNGALVSEVTKGSPAAKAGIKRGDIILKYNNSEIEDFNQLRALVSQTPTNQSVDIELMRNGKRVNVTATIKANANSDKLSDSETGGKLGFTVEDISGKLQKQFGLPDQDGVVITKVNPDSAAENAGLKAGDQILEINQAPINSVSDFENLMKQLEKQDSILLLIRRQNMVTYVVLRFDTEK